MCDVYERALLALAATGDETGEKGLFLNRQVLDHPLSAHLRLKDNFLAVQGSHVQSRTSPLVMSISEGPLYTERGAQGWNQSCFDEELCESKWTTRGWILQERLLSRRIVYFGKRQLYWECQKKFKNEDGPPASQMDC